MKKIAFIGTHGTGKTTLAHGLIYELKKQNKRVEFLEEVARLCPLPINEETSKEAQEWIIYTHYAKELEHLNKCEILVCDRSVLDSYAYYMNRCGENLVLENFIAEKIQDYAFLFRVPINQDYLKEDGIRTIDPVFQKNIDEKMDYILDKLSVKYHTINNLKEVLKIIKNDRSI